MKYVKIIKSDIESDMKYIVDIDKSLPIKKSLPTVIKTENGFLFPEDVHFLNHKDECLYAFGPTRVWRTTDMERWELVK